MSIKMQDFKNGLSGPIVECDVCHRPITRAEPGIAVYDWIRGGNAFTAPAFRHKTPKCDAASTRVGGCWEDLDVWFRYLLWNCGVEITPEVKKRADMIMAF